MKRLRPIASVVLALLTLLSASSFTVGVHLCQGRVQHVALFTKAEGCAMEKQLPPCHRHKASSCCEDETIVHEGQGFKAPLTDVVIAPATVVDLELPVVLIAEIIPASPRAQNTYYNYDPPLRSEDLTVSFRTLLI
ncbi:HYC_CC_PP family protein [Ohtaekwangia sp.]|uniref:HYC_CC_PP family protein n=1 Tax=Ohtaekwangia sp. TaxID=2066019 RepID=UPI002F945EC5